MVIFPIDCFIFHVTKTDFLQVLRPQHMICSCCDPWLMDGKDPKHNGRLWAFSPLTLQEHCRPAHGTPEMKARRKHHHQTMFTMEINRK